MATPAISAAVSVPLDMASRLLLDGPLTWLNSLPYPSHQAVLGVDDRAPLLVVTPPGHETRTTQARWAAAPPAPRLLLLPSGPDRVHGTRSRRTRPSTRSHETPLRTAHPSKGNSTPLKRIAGTGHRWLPV